MENNPLFIDYNLQFDTIPFDKIKTQHFVPAIHEAIKMSNNKIDTICSCEDSPNFNNTILAFETSHEDLERIVGIYWHLFAAHSEGDFKKLAEEISPLLSSHTNDYMLNATLFSRIESLFVAVLRKWRKHTPVGKTGFQNLVIASANGQF